MARDQELVTVLTLQQHSETLRYEALLNGSGIFYTWKDAESISIDPLAAIALGGIKLQVYQDDVIKVQHILAKAGADQVSLSQRFEIERDGIKYTYLPNYCPNCDEYGVYLEHRGLSTFFTRMFTKRMTVCNNCNHEW